jgi:hypothetical protein
MYCYMVMNIYHFSSSIPIFDESKTELMKYHWTIRLPISDKEEKNKGLLSGIVI